MLHCELEGSVVADTLGGAGNEGSIKWQEFVSLFEKGIEKFDEEIAAAIAHPLYSLAAQSNTTFSLVRPHIICTCVLIAIALITNLAIRIQWKMHLLYIL